ncbi:uncharacterized protein HMPREF1541_09760 [Cyphellophora europaea CBS 101466]|uniref:RING-type domain-containing protein n=1 Tax=Cyphellophora europaea (strain CBS 101466) TaxID=1220924 RepID=W2S8E2_CYPE1|nr:uncharacterized protein HMPREF1541_09760 [Cyphellophora europaea CBS 101466]ETN44885.1 hypothetical protein HMPREF1541_09760 [Cyphellophora europaea CBS 101466]
MDAGVGRTQIDKLQTERDRLQDSLTAAADLLRGHGLSGRLRRSLLGAQTALTDEIKSYSDHILAYSTLIADVENQDTSTQEKINPIFKELDKTENLLLGERPRREFLELIAGRSPTKKLTTGIAPILPQTCGICGDGCNPGKDLKATCGHWVCPECLAFGFAVATNSRSKWPFKCCDQDVELEDAKKFVDDDIMAKYVKNSIEYAMKTPIWCASGSGECACIPLDERTEENVDRVCTWCNTATCMRSCKPAHEGVCEIDGPDEGLRQLAEQEGWATCPVCCRIIELTHGSFHIFCNCKAEFCYKCTTTWKSCICALHDKDLLLKRAQEVLYSDKRSPRDQGALLRLVYWKVESNRL